MLSVRVINNLYITSGTPNTVPIGTVFGFFIESTQLNRFDRHLRDEARTFFIIQ